MLRAEQLESRIKGNLCIRFGDKGETSCLHHDMMLNTQSTLYDVYVIFCFSGVWLFWYVTFCSMSIKTDHMSATYDGWPCQTKSLTPNGNFMFPSSQTNIYLIPIDFFCNKPTTKLNNLTLYLLPEYK